MRTWTRSALIALLWVAIIPAGAFALQSFIRGGYVVSGVRFAGL